MSVIRLFDDDDIPAVGSAGPGFADVINDLLEKINRRSDAIVIPAVVGGVVDNTSMIEDLIGGAPYGSTLRFADPGPVGCSAIPPILNNVRIIGAGGRFGTYLTPLADTSDPILDFAMAGGSSIWEAYGPALERIAIDMTAAPSATGVRTSVDTGWFECERVKIKGGYRSVEHHGPNATFDRCFFDYPSDCHMYIDDGGLEVEISRMNFARNVAGTTDAFMKVILASGGQKGDLRLTSIQAGCAPSVGAVMTNGIIISAPTATDLPVFAKRVTIDNVSGGGPGLTLVNIAGVDWEGGWINTAGSPGAPCVRITGGSDLTFRGNKYRGGGAQLKTYDFVGGTTIGFTSVRNYCPTGPVYWLPASGKPIDMTLDDYAPGATVVGQITNDVEGLRAGTAKRWGPFDSRERLSQTAVPWMSSPAIAIDTLAAGTVTMSAPDIDSFYSQFIPFRLAPVGTIGRLEVGTRDTGADTVVIRSVRSDGTTETGDTSAVGYLRFEIAH